MTSDPFDEFEFKPLTEGLGFHKKTEKSIASTETRFELKNSMPEIELPIAPKAPEGRVRGQRKPSVTETKIDEVSSSVDEILKTLAEKRKIDFLDSKVAAKQEPLFRTTVPDFSAMLLDSMLVTASSLGCLIILLMVTKVDLFSILTQSPDLSAALSVASIFAANAWIYLVMNRVFLGYTPGEWVFDQRLGLPVDLGQSGYSLKVVLRSSLVVVTGLILVPLLSMILNSDLAGKISGVQIFKKV